uniref:Legume lectin domain-containing protein n=1 Tax=Ananas comosus var. bracteatus TaxID=296719 RepID=A0A6V7PF50_ANACO|nr:unnamed protein product [Ananas comosus var. bracteatus]
MDKSSYGDGLAFFLSPSPSVLPSFSSGGYLGLFNNGTALNSTQNQLVAVEVDTYKNYWDPSACHVGIDINSINSTVYEDLPNITRSGTRATVSIVYDNTTKYLSVLLSYDGNPNDTNSFSLSCLVDLKAILPQEVTVGFSAATGAAVELHQILYWNFNSTLERKSNLTITSPPTQPAPPSLTYSGKSNVGVAAGSAAGIVALLCLVAAVWCFLSSRKKVNTTEEEEGGMDDEDDLIDDEQCIVQTEDRSKVSLVEWVWDLYGRKSVLEAADERLNGDFEEPEMERLMVVGLWCAHPDYNRRPPIKQAIGVLRFEIPLPALPPKIPVLVSVLPMDLSNFNYTSSSSTGTSASVVSSSANSTTASESSSSWLLK